MFTEYIEPFMRLGDESVYFGFEFDVTGHENVYLESGAADNHRPEPGSVQVDADSVLDSDSEHAEFSADPERSDA